ncbi:MAG6450 family protein [Gemella bergeri]
MSKKIERLTNVTVDKSLTMGSRLDSKTTKFKITIQHNLNNNFSFNIINKNNGHKEFHKFICNTVGKKLSISEVNRLYLRTRGKNKIIEIEGVEFEEVHYGRDQSAFRIFGYHHGGEFILTRIDTNHKSHK